MSQKIKRKTVRIRGELIPLLDELVEKAKDEYGLPIFGSKSEAVSQAVREFLERYKSVIREALAK